MQNSQFGTNQQCISSHSRDGNVLTFSRFGDVCLRPFMFLLMLAAMVCVVSLPLSAQNSYGSVVGTVSDTTGAAIPGALVSATSRATGEVASAKSSETGNYTILNLKPGQYSVKVEFKGFKTFVQKDLDVQIGGSLRVNTQLAIGQESETIVVTGAPPDLQTDSADLGGVIEEKQIQDTPLNGRNVNNLLTLVPGVIAGGGTSGSTTANYSGGAMTQPIAYGNYQIGGGFSGQSLYYVDGAPVNATENNVDSLVPTQDAVQEFRVSTNSVSAEYGGFAGGVINFGTKSGTNKFHGSAYEYLRNTVFDANDWFSNHNGLGRTPLHQNQYGANLGGPILKNKTFFFFSWEHERITSAAPASYTIPTADEMNGDFSAVADSNPIYDPTTGTQLSCNGVANVICPARIDSAAKKIMLATYPTVAKPGSNNFSVSSRTSGWQDQYNTRIDHHFGEKNTFFARYTFWNPSSGPNDPWGTKVGLSGTSTTTHNAVIGDTHVIKPTLIADIRLSHLRTIGKEKSFTYGRDISSFGSAYSTLQTEFNEGVLPYVSFSDHYSSANGNALLDWTTGIYTLSPSLTKIAGRHTIKIGGVVRQVAWTTGPGVGSDVNFTASSSFTSISSDATSGNSLASFLLGLPTTTKNTQSGGTHGFLHSYGFYVTDTYQVTPKLTATLGLRWDQPSAYSEKDNLNTVFLPNEASSLGTISNPVTNSSQTLQGNLALVNSSAYSSRRSENLHWNLFDPRVGLAYRATDKTVVRIGYGISHLPSSMSQDGPDLSPVNASSTTLTNTSALNPTTTVSDPFPTGINLPTLRSASGLNDVLGQSFYAAVPDNSVPYVQQYNLTVERTLDSKTTASLSYVGSKGTHLFLAGAATYSMRNLNQLPDQYLSMGTALMDSVKNPLYGKITSGLMAGSTVFAGNMLQPYPQYQRVKKEDPREASSTYNALQASLNRHFGNGGVLGLAYTWSKLLSNTDSVNSFMDGADSGGVGMIQNNNNLRSEKSLSMQDFPMNLQISYSIDLPFGAHQRYLKDAGKVVVPIVSGWRMSGITTFRSGAPIAVTGAPNNLSLYFGASNDTYGLAVMRPNVVAGCSKGGSRTPKNGVISWFNADCFTSPDANAFGNESRTDSQLRADGMKNFDFSLIKSTPITEKAKLEFDAQFFNIFNRTQFAQPESWSFEPTFGQVSSQANNPRLMQFALRLAF